MQVFKKYANAKKANIYNNPIIVIGDHYIVLDDQPEEFTQHTAIELIDKNGSYVAQVTVRHLLRLGNANHAISEKEAKDKLSDVKTQLQSVNDN